MNKTTKILLALGLLMAIIIPVTVKGLFTDTDFFDISESSKIDYLQPYKPRPETAIRLPNGVGTSNTNGESSSRVRTQATSSYKSSRETKKVNVPVSDFSNEASESAAAQSNSDVLFYK